MPQTADLVMLDAKVLPMTAPGARAEALAVAGGRVLAVGSNDDIRALAGDGARIVDAAGRLVAPGFIESHFHIFPGAWSLRFLSLADVFGRDALARAIRDFAAANPDEGLLIATGANYGLLDGEGGEVDRHLFDEILPERPLLVQLCDWHNAWANTAALERAGLLHGRDVGAGAEIVMGSDGRATGLLKEFAAFLPVMALRSSGGREHLGLKGAEPDAVTAAERAEDKAVLRAGLAHCAGHGVTSIMNMDGNRYQLELLAELERAGDLPCRIEIPYHFVPGEPVANLAKAEAMRRDFSSARLWSRRLKLFMDGVLDAHTAFRLSDYPGCPGERGAPLHGPEAFAALATAADARGFQLSVHVIGDAAARASLDGFAAARAANGPRDSRHRLEHANMVTREDMARMAEMGVIASLQPSHPPGRDFPREPTLSVIGEADWPHTYPCRSFIEAGVAICFASDWPVAPLSPLNGVRAALARKPWAPGLPAEAIEAEQALHAYTAGGAHAAHMEALIGRLAPGMAADIVVLSATQSDLDAIDWSAVQVDMTFSDGRATFERR